MMVEWENIIIILQIYQSVIFATISFILFFRDGSYSKKYLGWFMVLSATFALYKGAYTPGLYQVFWYLFPIGIPLFLSFFPTFYFYIKSLVIRGYHFTGKEYRHIVAPILLFLLSLPYYFIAFDKQQAFTASGAGLLENRWLTFLKFAYYFFVYGYFNFQVVFYSIRIAKLYQTHKINLEKDFSYKKSIKLLWVIILTLLVMVFLFLLGLSYVIGLNQHDSYHTWINLVLMLIILLLGIFGILQKDIYPHHDLDDVNAEPESSPLPEAIDPGTHDQETVECVIMQQSPAISPETRQCDEEDCSRAKKYAGSGLTERQKKALVKNLEKLMKDKIFLNGKLTIDDVADKLETNSKYLSQVINESYNQNFYTYINTFRIHEARRLLKDKHHQKYSIQGIARLVGFSSKSSFNEAFRRIAGMTPSEYLKKDE